MAAGEAAPLAVSGVKLCKTFITKSHSVQALRDVDISLPAGSLTALAGPDGAGKTTLMRLLTGLYAADSGELTVLGLDAKRQTQALQTRIAYMPQRFGLYEDLSVQENLDLYADMHGVPAVERPARYAELMEMTDLSKFLGRLAGRLSGGMKQKLGLACALVRWPELLLLDEPTVGVDPLSRRELWQIIRRLVAQQGITVLVSTAYLDEAEHCRQAIVLAEGRVLAACAPQELSRAAAGKVFLLTPPPGQAARNLQARLLDRPTVADALPQGAGVRVTLRQPLADPADAPWPAQTQWQAAVPNFEDGFMLLTSAAEPRLPPVLVLHHDGRAPPAAAGEIVIEVRDLVRRFGDFVAVNHVSFQVRRGEIFGLLGPNGAGKTTTFRMLCGLLAASSGELRVLGQDLRFARAASRRRIGYVAQKFALYGELSVRENLEFFASAYGLRGGRRRERLHWAIEQFELSVMLDVPSGRLPGGYRQRLAMAAALMHEPEVLFLDEPTSGADPRARREFWRRITDLSDQGVTVIVTTHFMEEAEYCDRALIQDGGRILAQGAPAEIRRLGARPDGGAPTMENAFISIVSQARLHE